MNLHITSNSINKFRTNLTNDFEMKLAKDLDGLNSNLYLEVLQISYPLTSKNVREDLCFCVVNLEFGIDNGASQANTPEFYEYTEKFIVPNGVYAIDKLLDYLNSQIEEFDIILTRETSGRIKMGVNVYVEFWEQKTTFKKLSQSIENEKIQFNFKMKVTLSPKMAFMLGFEDEDHEFGYKWDVYGVKNTIVNSFFTKIAKYLPDMSDGINKMYIYCKEIESEMVGDSLSELLIVLPLQWKGQGVADGDLAVFSPPKILRKFKKMYVHSLNIKIQDTKGKLISFDSGSVSIDCLIHNA